MIRASAEGQAAHDAGGGGDPCAGEIPAGSSCTIEVVFGVPADARDLRLRVSMGGPFANLISHVFDGRKELLLP